MSRVIAAYDLDEDHGRLWVNADLKRMPEFVIVANQPTDRAQTVTYVPEVRMLEAMDAAREAGHRADMAERVAADRKGLCDSLRETNDDLRRIIDEMKDTERLADENAKLREELSKWERLTAGIDLPEYPVTQFKPKDLERENAQLRKLCADLYDHAAFSIGYFGDTYGILPRMRELRVEVDG